MKPPRRLRFLPSRLAEAPRSPERPRRGAWGLREKRELLAALRAQARSGLPEQRLPAALRERLPRRSEEEIRSFLVRLRGRAAREALTSKFRKFLLFRRRIRAPIQVWQDLAETLGGGVPEGPPSAAFSQVLTVAATEPLTLEHSRPPRNSGTFRNSETPPAPGRPQNPGLAPNPGNLEVDFGKIYEFLARIGAGGEGEPPLAPAESAVLLALLGSLPAQLGALGALGALGSLRSHFRGLWGSLRGPSPPLNPLLVPLGILGALGRAA
ncbi:snRNA-activating protein complex subunit 2 isoform X1 [Poecile atricapillus]|uniref:snRNA-activating protein complex subunit 2 isoform X1 n=1 Tax=Poecile atricapillus TaxID=48891 RepID=UPI00273A37AC|nr:snRNA-activating protein complex subunit 2 isoform X1 [Poecile atricapillus]